MEYEPISVSDALHSVPDCEVNLNQCAENENNLLTVADAATLLNVSARWIYARARFLPHIRVGSGIRFDRNALLSHLRLASRRGSTGAPQETPEGNNMLLGLQRYQRGRMYKAGKRIKVWRAMWREDIFDTEGKLVRRVRHHQTIGTVAELPTVFDARTKLDGLMRAAPERRIELTFSNLVERWRRAALPALRSTTGAYYENLLDRHLLPEFGSRNIAGISKYDVQLFLASRAAKYARASLHGMRVAFGKVLSWAVECRWLTENPCNGVKIPQGTGKRVRQYQLTASDANRLAAALKEPYSTLVLLLAATGVRISEAVGLRWQDVTPNGLTIRQRVYAGKADDLKTAASRRNIHLPAHIMARVLALRSGGEYVFQTREGTPPWPNNAMHRYIRPAAKKLGIPLTGYHDFRHGLITRLAEKKVSPKVAAAIAGHSDIRTTLAIYTHVGEDAARSAIEEVAGQLVHDGTRFQKQNQQTAVIHW
ncbi:MAG: tyrosine-type recombinase/integrase [Acidobacteria bacterium]|nr:tyrosine-type recombinase/integrase [Acidobacteriota bacterium]MBI3662285.1 tyrosine-type recombinase/integrase [Acidobacteriota bacterium]